MGDSDYIYALLPLSTTPGVPRMGNLGPIALSRLDLLHTTDMVIKWGGVGWGELHSHRELTREKVGCNCGSSGTGWIWLYR